MRAPPPPFPTPHFLAFCRAQRATNTHDNTNTELTHTSMPLSGIRTHDPSFRASEDSSCLRPHGHGDRRCETSNNIKSPPTCFGHNTERTLWDTAHRFTYTFILIGFCFTELPIFLCRQRRCKNQEMICLFPSRIV
jgi:hypothetical protein